MKLIRIAYRNNLLLWLLAMAVGLRSLIAPGFMLETNGDGPLGLGIILCEGLNGQTPLVAAEAGPHASHTHHAGITPQDDPSASGLESTTSCGSWATSSLYLQAVVFPGDQFFSAPEKFHIEYLTPATAEVYTAWQRARAPPVFSII